MTENYLYPEDFDEQNPSPELMALWDDAMNRLRKRRTFNLLWQLPLFGILLLASIVLLGPFALVIFPIFGILDQTIVPHYFYKVSDDRKSAIINLEYRHEFRRIFITLPWELLSKAKEGFGGLIIGVVGFVTLPFWWPLLSSLLAFDYINNLFWLKSFNKWTDQIKGNMKRRGDPTHIRGTFISPSVQLSGSGPSVSTPPPIPQPLEVLDGLLTLNPDGSIVILGGASFDRNSRFSGFSINGVTLTRESEDLLKGSRDGSDFVFRFEGNSWIAI